jgi:hydroxyacylglutathione hydrolase
MYFKQFYLGCLAHASYLIGSGGEAAVVDPQRDVDQYINEARSAGLSIRYVIETHLHADFVSGHRELAARTGAEIIFGQKAGATFDHREVRDGDQLHLGTATLRFLETPGHTPESISIIVTDSETPDAPEKVLTGDALFIGDVGRPDLVGAKGYTAEQMAGMLFDSLHNKLLTLDDRTEVYPAHGAGSMCGRNISRETSSTIGEQRRFNYALKPMSKQEFVHMMTTDLPEPPGYFPRDAEINRSGAPMLRDLPRPAELTPLEVDRLIHQGHLALDVRNGAAFGAGHVPQSLNIGLGGQFASWAGTLIALEQPIILIADNLGEVDEAQMRLARVGIESVKGYLGGGIHAWNNAGLALSVLPQMPVDELKNLLNERKNLQLVDVRRPGEYEAGHAPSAVNLPLSKLTSLFNTLDRKLQTVVICQSGYRSSAACSLLAQAGFSELVNVVGGTSAWLSAGYAAETGAQPKLDASDKAAG